MDALEGTIERRALALFEGDRLAICRRADRLFAVLLLCQWLIAVGIAFWITPRTWAGRYYQTHIHVWAALLLGGAIASFPALLGWRNPGRAATRYAISAAQMLMSALLIHLTGGRIETHFHVFASLAILAFYRDWKVFLPATTVIAGDHLIRGIYWPQSVFGVAEPSHWRWIEHAAWVLIEDAFLIRSCFQSVREMKSIARQKAELQANNERIEETIRLRTAQLDQEVADRRVLEIQLSQAQKLESIGHLAAGIAHEINTPIQYVGDNSRFLGGAFASLDRLMREHIQFAQRAGEHPELRAAASELTAMADREDVAYFLEEVPRAVEQSVEGVARVASIVLALKEFSHPDTTEKELINVNRAIENTLVVCRNEWKYVADVRTQLDDALPLVPCLGGEINQVVLNLVVNAAHAIADKNAGTGEKGRITVSTRRDREWVEIAVGDDGTGIPLAIQPRIFTPFFTTKEVGKGTGQGLCLAHTVVVKKHGGTLEFTSREGVGTTFVARLPLEMDERLKAAHSVTEALA